MKTILSTIAITIAIAALGAGGYAVATTTGSDLPAWEAKARELAQEGVDAMSDEELADGCEALGFFDIETPQDFSAMWLDFGDGPITWGDLDDFETAAGLGPVVRELAPQDVTPQDVLEAAAGVLVEACN